MLSRPRIALVVGILLFVGGFVGGGVGGEMAKDSCLDEHRSGNGVTPTVADACSNADTDPIVAGLFVSFSGIVFAAVGWERMDRSG